MNQKCSSCLPQERGKCQNFTTTPEPISPTWLFTSTSIMCLQVSVPISSPSVTVKPILPSSIVHTGFPAPPSLPSQDRHYLDYEEYSLLIQEAYSMPICYSSTTFHNNEWESRWYSVTQLSGRHYDLPRSACGRRYVSLLNDEICFLNHSTFTSKRVLFFSAVVLQWEKIVKSRKYIIRTLDRRMDLWLANRFVTLLQEAIRCNQSFNTHCRPLDQDKHTRTTFTCLMLQGKVSSATRWITERSKGSVLLLSDTTSTISNSIESSLSVVDALKLKHPLSSPSLLYSSLTLFYSFVRRPGRYWCSYQNHCSQNQGECWSNWLQFHTLARYPPAAWYS